MSNHSLQQRQELRQSQQLVMTPQLQQAIKLLQLSQAELNDYVLSEMESNPLLESANNDSGAEAEEKFDDGEAAIKLDEGSLEKAYDDVHDQEGHQGETLGHIAGGNNSFNGSDFDLQDRVTSEIDLRAHLQQQLNIDVRGADQRMIGAALIDLVDDAGYLPADLSDVAETLGCTLEAIEGVLAVMQRFDPVGIMARSLKECLSIQLREKNRLDPCMAMLLDNLHLIAERNLKGLATKCGLATDEVIDMITEIKQLNPKPALAYDHAPAQHIIPDVQMRPNGTGGWIIELNPDALPRVLVSRQYSSEVLNHATRQDKEYLSEKLQAANWLVKALDQRANTILKVATEIVRHQSAFFTHGVTRLRPLVLREVAAAIEMHESTVSRVTANKFILTPRGVFELKYFFSSSINGTFGDSSFSAEAIRARIKALVDKEDPKEILSDDTLVDKLHEAGIDIARRTVAKYREQLHIASSVQRRREKAFA
jgi:RNA polymerase sigma-54 factor